MGAFNQQAMAEKIKEWGVKKPKPKITEESQYKKALNELRDYFRVNPVYERNHWLHITYLLQAVCKYEIAMGMGTPIEKG